MRRKLSVLAGAVFPLSLIVGVALARAPTDTLTTEIAIEFVEAVYFHRFAGVGGMDIEFGKQLLPISGPTFMSASDGDHTLRVCDRREIAGGWSVYASVSPFTSGPESFVARVCWFYPAATAGITPNLISGDSGMLVMAREDGGKIMDAAAGLQQGIYDLVCAEGNTRLAIGRSNVPLLKPLEYTATITWTLVLSPPDRHD